MATSIADPLVRRLGATLRRFARDRAGTTAVEFSIVSVPFLGLLFAIFQISYFALVQQGLDYATERGARAIKTGQLSNGSYNSVAVTDGPSFCTAVLAQYLPSYLKCANLLVSVQTASTAANMSTGNNWTAMSGNANNTNSKSYDLTTANRSFCLGQSGAIVAVRVTYPVPPMLSIVTLSSSLASIGQASTGQVSYNNGTTTQNVYPIMSVYAFQSEPYTAGTAATATGC